MPASCQEAIGCQTDFSVIVNDEKLPGFSACLLIKSRHPAEGSLEA
jgi:hypothetical protein